MIEIEKIILELNKKDVIKLLETLGRACTIMHVKDEEEVMVLIQNIATQAQAHQYSLNT